MPRLSASIRTKRFPRSLTCVWLVCLAAGLAADPARGQDRAPGVDASKPHVVRTFTHHQITADDRGVWALQPVVSDNGNRIVFGLNPAADGQPNRLAAVDFSGGNVAVLDDAPNIDQPDVTADGSQVVYIVNYKELRIVAGDGTGRRTLVQSIEGAINCPRLSGNGRVILFLATRGMTLRDGGQSQSYIRGVYAINPDGTHLRRVAGPDEIAKSRGVGPDDVGNPNFGLGYDAGSLDVSTNGGHVAFGCWVKGASVVFGCDIDGRNLHTIVERSDRKGDLVHNFGSIALSGDATTIAYHTVYPDQLGVAGFDGTRDKVLLQAGSPDERRFQWMYSAQVYISLDGARVTYSGRQFNGDGSGSFQLMYTHEEYVLRYLEYEQPAPDGNGRRFAYWPSGFQPLQLATMELNVPWDQLRGAPKVSDLVLDPPAIPREQQNVNVVRSRLAARVTADTPPQVSSTGFLKGIYDPGLYQVGSVGNTDLYDDGKTDTSGDEKAGDGIFTRRWLLAYADAADGPWTVRVEAQVTGAGKLRHATVVEIGTYSVVPGSDQPLPQGKTPTIDGTPPPQPTATPRPPGPVVSNPNSGNGPGPDGTGTSGRTIPPTVAAINLTGYWRSDTGAYYYVRQIGDKVYWYMDALPSARNTFTGTISGDTLTGTWVDLPGGETETGTGTLKIKIESNDKLTKISDSSPYGAGAWSRIAKPSGTGTTTAGTPTGTGAGGTGATAAGTEPYNTQAGQAAIDNWIAEATAKLNAYDGGKRFNDLKPWGIHAKYGTLTNKTATSAFAPDAFPRYNNNKYWYVWDHYVTDANGRWSLPEWNGAGVPDLHDYVLKRLKK